MFRYKNIKASYLNHGPAARIHGNKGKRPKRHLTVDQIKEIVQFVLSYSGKLDLNARVHVSLTLYML